MKPCTYASFCGKRMAHGDRANGCNHVDQQTCSPTMSVIERTPTAPPADPTAPCMKCTACQRVISRGDWHDGTVFIANPSCSCGAKSWVRA